MVTEVVVDVSLYRHESHTELSSPVRSDASAAIMTLYTEAVTEPQEADAQDNVGVKD